MTERATVQRVSDREVTVMLRSLAACGGCTACGAFAPQRPQLLRAGNPRGLYLRPGDFVEIGFAPGQAVRAGFTVLIVPLLLFLGGFAAAGAVGASEPLKVLAGIGGLAGGFVLAWLRGRSSGDLPEVVGMAPEGATAETAACCLVESAGPSLDGTESL